MKLIDCYVENYGTLNRFQLKFQEGINTINQLNGWGKTTLASFIRSMFYGISGSTAKRDIDESERKKYNPWQGGNWGGYLSFEHKGKRYKIERTFSTREKEDTFTLYNLDTGLKSTDFSENLGEELFGLDRAAFSRSTFFPQKGINLEANDSINAKLGHHLEGGSDLNNFETAIKKLTEVKKEYKQAGRKGKINVIDDQISGLQADLRRCRNAAETTTELSGRIGENLVKQQEIKDALKALQEQREQAARSEKSVVLKEQYDKILTDLEEARAHLTNLDGFFLQGMPTEDEIQGMETLHNSIITLQGELGGLALSDDEANKYQQAELIFKNGYPTEEEVKQCDQFFKDYNLVSAKLQANQLTEAEQDRQVELEAHFGQRTPDDNEIADQIQAVEELNECSNDLKLAREKLDMNREALAALMNQGKTKKRGLAILKYTGLVIAYLILALLLLVYIPVAGIVFLIAAPIVFFVLRKKMKSGAKDAKAAADGESTGGNLAGLEKQIEDLAMEQTRLEEGIKEFLNQFAFDTEGNYLSTLYELKQAASEYRQLIAKADKEKGGEDAEKLNRSIAKIDDALRPYNINLSTSVDNKLTAWEYLKESRLDFIRLSEKKAGYKKTEDTINEKKGSLGDLLKNYSLQGNLPSSEGLRLIREKRRDLIRFQGDEKKLLIDKADFEQDNDLQHIADENLKEYNLDEMKSHEDELNENLEILIRDANGMRRNIDSAAVDVDKMPEIEGEIQRLSEELIDCKDKHDVIESAIECLTTAKQNFTSKYMEGMNQAFAKYINLLDDGTLGDAKLDINLNANVEKFGKQWVLDYFSSGYKDLIGISTRFALVDALFTDEQPFLILDDPFVNLDGEKLDKALKLLDAASKEYQIVYFVCHDSRAS